MVAAQLGENNEICLATEKHAPSRSNLSMSKNVRMVFSMFLCSLAVLRRELSRRCSTKKVTTNSSESFKTGYLESCKHFRRYRHEYVVFARLVIRIK